MSGTSNPQFDRYMQREQTWYGRAINAVIDSGRDLMGKPDMYQQVISAQIMQEQYAQIQAKIDRLDEMDARIADSDLTMSNQQAAKSLIEDFRHDHPGASEIDLNLITDTAIDFMRRHEQEQVAAHQMELFTEASVAPLGLNREAGLGLIRDLETAMHEAEDRMLDDLVVADNLAPWDRVDDCMDRVREDPDAMAIMLERGFIQNEFGALRTSRDTAITSQELGDALRDLELEDHPQKPAVYLAYDSGR